MLFNIINNTRLICVKAIQLANSGHPGMPLGIADIIVIMWYLYYKNNFNIYNNLNKDKIIISNGHGTIIKYVLLYLTKIYSIEDIKNFRKFNSKTPAHSEISNFIDASTGPLGQGISIGIGIALKTKIFAYKFNKKINLFKNKIWIFCGDGCLMEGISTESISFCGVYNINNIILIYDSNNISIDGIVNTYFFENIKQKFFSMNWDVIGPINGHNYIDIIKSFKLALKSYFPILIYFKTIIGFLSSDKSYNESVHGSIFKFNELKNIYKNFTINFYIKKKFFFCIKNKYILFYKKNYLNLFLELIRIKNSIILKINFVKLYLKNFLFCINKSTRLISNIILKNFYKINEFIGGSADLSISNLTKVKNILSIKKNFFGGRCINYGVREFSMCLINYGLSVDKDLIVFCSTFLVFSNYMYSAIRNLSISKLKNIILFTHDSFSVGEDGPSHQPIEQLKCLRSILRVYVFRPYNLYELLISWFISIKLRKNSCCLILSRQNFKNNFFNFLNIKNSIKGFYNLNYIKKKIDLIIISSGSDLEYIFYSYCYLKKYFNILIISNYCELLFEKQKKNYKKNFFKKKILILESSNDNFWYKYNKKNIFILNIKKYGKSGSKEKLDFYYNFNKKFILKLILFLIKI